MAGVVEEEISLADVSGWKSDEVFTVAGEVGGGGELS